MKRKTKNRIRKVAMFVLGTAFMSLVACAGTFDRQAKSETYVLHGVYNGFKFVADNGESWDYEQDILTWETLTIDGEVMFREYSLAELYKTVESDTLVHVKINDNGTSDYVSDDYPELIAYDHDGMFDRWIAEIDARTKERWEFIEKTDEFLNRFEK